MASEVGSEDGVRDVDAMEAQELVQHKAVVVMTSHLAGGEGPVGSVKCGRSVLLEGDPWAI